MPAPDARVASTAPYPRFDEAPPAPSKWAVLAVVALGTFVGPLDGTIVNVAIAPLGRAFAQPLDHVEWVLLAYLLVLTTLLIPFGRFGDLIGHKRVYVCGIAVFGLGSLLCAFAPGLWWLVAFRIVQAIGASMQQAVSSAIITATFPSSERGRALGLNGASVALGLSLGPLVGGALITGAGWRWIFLVTVPIALVELWLATAVLRRGKQSAEGFDLLGGALLSAALFILCLALTRAHVWGWGSPPIIGLLAAVPCIATLFLAVESRVEHPTLDLTMFRNRIFAFSVLAAVGNFMCQYAIIFTVPLALQTALGETALRAGLTLAPLAFVIILLAPTAGALSDRLGARYLASAGCVLTGLGALALATMPDRPTEAAVTLRLLLVGCGVGCFNQPNNSTIMGNVERRRLGVAAGILATARNTGMVLGTAVAGAIYFFAASRLPPAAVHTIAAAKAVFFGVAAISVVVALLSYSRGHSRAAAAPGER